jgi:protein-tyrosine phosphatase
MRPESPTNDDTPEVKDVLMRKQFEIEDNPTEDILQYLKEACDWIEISLASAKENEGGDQFQLGVLVHGTEGISRSGTIVVAYCKSH